MAGALMVSVPFSAMDALLLRSYYKSIENQLRTLYYAAIDKKCYLDCRNFHALAEPVYDRLLSFGDAIETNGLTLHYCLVDRRDRQQSLAWNRRRKRRRTWVERFNESAQFQVSKHQRDYIVLFGFSLPAIGGINPLNRLIRFNRSDCNVLIDLVHIRNG